MGETSEPSSGSIPRRLITEERVAGAAMVLICLISMANVVVRYLTNYSFGFTEEVSVFLLVVITLTGTAGAFRRGSHLAMTFLAERAPAALRRWLELLGLAVAFVLFASMVWYGGLLTLDDYDLGSTSMGIGLPAWWYSVWLPVLSVLVCVRNDGRLFSVWRGPVPGTVDQTTL
ncbi:MAG: TRAP transporter small permease [Burkholderiaceae bacterium]